MHTFINSPWKIGTLTLTNRLIQGPLAGYSCAPFRELFNQFLPPAYCVSEMISAVDVLTRHNPNSRYLYRSPFEGKLAYQISGTDAVILAKAALKLEHLGADIIDINCGCPKNKIRKKGAGSALLDNPNALVNIVKEVRDAIAIPLTVKIRIQENDADLVLAKKIEEAGADALIVHGRRWIDNYSIACNIEQISLIKQNVSIPVIANGDVRSRDELNRTVRDSQCDGFMLSRAGTGQPWLYQELLEDSVLAVSLEKRIALFMQHLRGLSRLENEYKAILQSKSLVRYYFRELRNSKELIDFYALNSLKEIEYFLM